MPAEHILINKMDDGWGNMPKILDTLADIIGDDPALVVSSYLMERSYNFGLYYACAAGHIKLVRYLISCGANSFDWGLLAASIDGHTEIVRIMLSRGARNQRAFLNACVWGHLDIVELLVMHGATSWNAGMKLACEGGHIQVIQLMIRHGACNWQDGLIEAAIYGRVEAARLMIAHGAVCYNAALRCACQNKHRAVADMLIKAGATECHRDTHYHGPLS